MKNNYNKKKRITIIALSALAVCLAGGLFWYVGTLGNTQPPVTQTESQPEPESTVTVPAIKPEGTSEPVTSPAETEPETIPEPETTTVPETTKTPEATEEPEPETASAAVTVTQDVKTKPSAGKPKAPDEATSPAEPPKEESTSAVPVENPDVDGQCQPEHTPQPEAGQPQGGETNSSGAVYVPGFGYVENSGPVKGETVDSGGDWNKQIGTMQ